MPLKMLQYMYTGLGSPFLCNDVPGYADVLHLITPCHSCRPPRSNISAAQYFVSFVSLTSPFIIPLSPVSEVSIRAALLALAPTHLLCSAGRGGASA